LAKRKIAIVGGGVAGLTTAFELTRTEALRERYDVSVYQLGWRLGGKAASSRDSCARIIEHGLHVWFGCYENAFKILDEAYHAWAPQPGQAIKSIYEAFLPQKTTEIGSGDRPQFVEMSWDRRPGHAGIGEPNLDFWSCVAQLQSVIKSLFQLARGVPAPVSRNLSRFALVDSQLDEAVKRAQELTNPALRTNAKIRSYVAHIRGIANSLVIAGDDPDDPGSVFRTEMIDVGTAIIKGLIFDVALGGLTIAELDQMEFRDWLCENGAHRSSVYGSFVVRALYDSMLQYVGGDPRQPSYGAGTAAQVVLRLYGSYRGEFVYELAAGMGEVVVAPIYGALVKQNVQFKFFHKLTGIGLNAQKDGVATLTFDEQVRTKNGGYRPTKPPCPETGWLEYWPNEPDWDQIDLSCPLACEELESYWCQQKVGECTLRQGDHFDDVVLAIPVTAFMRLNPDDDGPCAELIAASPRFRRMTQTASPVPSLGFQAWMTKATEDLGGVKGAQLSTGPRPLNIWADRTPELNYQSWTSEAPKSMHFLCDVLETDLFRKSANTPNVMKTANERARKAVLFWLLNEAAVLWPKVGSGASFDWSLLFDPANGSGEERLDGQIIKANVSPTDCCAGSPAGSTRWRLQTDRSGFRHLFLTGSWIDTGFNTECIEVAVMSGRQAARAITGEACIIPGERFPDFPPNLLTTLIEIAEETIEVAEALAETILVESDDSAGGRPRRRSGAR
jgi:uncharacterized protein with NAD-binding domain and iron-sulfur cluster